jgi:hypothetical protein
MRHLHRGAAGSCARVQRDPVHVCSEDKHIYCRGCIDRWKTTCIPTTCPICRALLSREESATKERDEILLLGVRCPHAGCCDSGSGSGSGSGSSRDVAADAEDGHQHKKTRQDDGSLPATSCGWTGPLQDYEAHVAVCPFVEIACPFAEAGCAFRAARRDMGSHRSDAAAHLLLLMTTVAGVKAESAVSKAKNEAMESVCVDSQLVLGGS